MKRLSLLGLIVMFSHTALASNFVLRDGALWSDGQPVLHEVPAGFTQVADPSKTGVFLKWTGAAPTALLRTPLGRVAGMRRFTSCHRDEPFWMIPRAGTNESQVALETQWLLAQTDAGDCVMLVPLLTDKMVFTLSGTTNGLQLTGETGEDAVQGTGGVALFVSVGHDPYALADSGAKAVMRFLGTGKLRTEKKTPDFADQFGWCTWDSFYKKVSADGVRRGLESFRSGGIEPKLLILDDGWQDFRAMPGGEERLVSLEPSQAQFGGDLRPTVRLAKNDFGVKTFLVWHAFTGYWGGVDGAALPQFDVQERSRSFGPGILTQHSNLNTQYWGSAVGVIPPAHIGKFYDDYHRRLEAAGVDGVKVDNQSMIESVAQGLGGRVAVTRAYRTALEKSVAKHFDGRLINCMANAMETYYCSPRSTLMRTSIDFWPKRPESHGQHIYCNAQMGLWFGEFMQPDWDMFQSAHPFGAFHAAGRAVSGGPVYVSDTPDAHDFDLLKKLVCSDGSMLRADFPGRATPDCLFADVTREPVLLKVFNFNRDCAVLGVFNCNYHQKENERPIIAGTVEPSDVPGLAGNEFVGFAQRSGKLWRCGRNESMPLTLSEADWEIVSFAPVEHGVAVLGLADKLNSTGAVMAKRWNQDGSLTVTLRDGGKFLAWGEHKPNKVTVGGQPIDFEYETTTGKLSCPILAGGKIDINLKW